MSDYRMILACVDFSDAAAAVIHRARELADRFRASLTVLHVVDYQPPLDLDYGLGGYPGWNLDLEAITKGAEQRLDALCNASACGEASRQIVVGAPKLEIPRYAQEHGAELIVIGSHGRSGFRRLLGSTANAVLNTAPCDVVAVRIADA